MIVKENCLPPSENDPPVGVGDPVTAGVVNWIVALEPEMTASTPATVIGVVGRGGALVGGAVELEIDFGSVRVVAVEEECRPGEEEQAATSSPPTSNIRTGRDRRIAADDIQGRRRTMITEELRHLSASIVRPIVAHRSALTSSMDAPGRTVREKSRSSWTTLCRRP